MTTATTTTTLQIIDTIGWMRKNNRAARAERKLPNNDVKFAHLSFWRQREPLAVNLCVGPCQELNWVGSKQPQIYSFHIVTRLVTTKKCTKIYKARAEPAIGSPGFMCLLWCHRCFSCKWLAHVRSCLWLACCICFVFVFTNTIDSNFWESFFNGGWN